MSRDNQKLLPANQYNILKFGFLLHYILPPLDSLPSMLSISLTTYIIRAKYLSMVPQDSTKYYLHNDMSKPKLLHCITY